MRAFVILSFIAVAAAQYEYAQNQPGLGLAQNSYSSGSAQLSEPIPLPVQNEFSKEFYSYSAPEHEFDEPASNDHLSSVKKNLRVVFIRGPENKGLENAALQLAKSASEDRTAIYVLTKQSDISNLAQQLNAIKSNNAQKPEVHFVKYRTDADADHAQRTIQQQYDSLPGSSISTNGGHAPVLNFASQAPSGFVSQQRLSQPSNAYVPPQPQIAPQQPQGTYLPASRKL